MTHASARTPRYVTMLSALALAICGGAVAAQILTPLTEPVASYGDGDDEGYVDLLVSDLPQTKNLRAVSEGFGLIRRSIGEVERRADGSETRFFTRLTLPAGMRPDETLRLAVAIKALDGLPVSMTLRNASGALQCPTSWSPTARSAGCNHVFRVSDLIGTASRNSSTQDWVDVTVAPTTTRRTSVEVDAMIAFTDVAARQLQVVPTVAPDGTSILRFSWDDRRIAPDVRIGRVVELRDGETPIRSVMMRSFGHSGGSFTPLSPVAPSSTTDSRFSLSTHFGGRRFLNGVAFVAPDSGAPITIDVSGTPYSLASTSPPADLSVELYRAARDATKAATDGIRYDQAPDLVINDARSPINGRSRETRTLTGGTLTPGLWYVRPASTVPMNVDVSIAFGQAQRGRTPRFGHYFNPKRSGHGISLSPAGDDWVLIWYTYDAWNAPTWYYAQAPKPLPSTLDTLWSAPLWRMAWNGERTQFQDAGHVQLSATGGDTLEMTWTLDGEGGSEPMVPLGSPGCPQSIGGVALDVNGPWFSPRLSGFGYSVEMIGDQEFFLGYLYDEDGLPRWITAQDRFSASARSLVALQSTGFCPTCDAKPTSLKPVGTLSRRFTTDAGGGRIAEIGTDVRYVGQAWGGWSRSLPTERLGAPFGCR